MTLSIGTSTPLVRAANEAFVKDPRAMLHTRRLQLEISRNVLPGLPKRKIGKRQYMALKLSKRGKHSYPAFLRHTHACLLKTSLLTNQRKQKKKKRYGFGLDVSVSWRFRAFTTSYLLCGNATPICFPCSVRHDFEDDPHKVFYHRMMKLERMSRRSG